MARLARSSVVGYPHHVTQRGNYDQVTFETEADYRRYLGWLREYADRFGVGVWAYCLMPNHVHFVCVPEAEGALARAFNTLHMRYAQYFNRRRSVQGHLWRARFMSCMLDGPSALEEMRFIENNPVRAGLAVSAEDYPWSSALCHVTGTPDPVLDGCDLLASAGPSWGDYLLKGADEPAIRRVRERLRTGRPAGEAAFVREIEAVLGRRLEARPRGRPRKAVGLPSGAAIPGKQVP